MKSSHLKIGTSAAGRPFTLPVEIVTQTIGIVGIRGSGKTNTATVIVEELLAAELPAVIIDPTDAWWGLQSSGDGERAGYNVLICGGSHGNLPLSESDGRELARFVVEEQMPVILSLRHLRKNAQRRFVTEFAEELFHLKGRTEHRSALTVVIDEAPLFVPQKVLGEVARTVGAVEDLIARGRNAGFGVVLISQRSATINKDVLTQADTLITHRLTGVQDRRAVKDWIEENATAEDQQSVLSSLARLKNGQAWVWGPRLDVLEQVTVRLRQTFDSSATPKLGQKIKPPRKLAEIDIEQLKTQLAISIEMAKADDPKELRKVIRKLEKQLEAPHLDSHEVKRQIDAALREQAIRFGSWWLTMCDAQQKELERLKDSALSHVGEFHKTLRFTPADLDLLLEFPLEPDPDPKTIHSPAGNPFPVQAVATCVLRGRANNPKRVTPPPASPNHIADNGKMVGGGQRRILLALAQHPEGLSAVQLGIHARISSKSGSFRTYLSALRRAGHIEGGKSLTRITPAGLESLGDWEPLPTGAALIDHWRQQLGDDNGARRIFDVLVDFYPHSLGKDKLGEKAGLTNSGSFRTYLSTLRKMSLIEYDGAGGIVAAAELFR